MWGLSLLSWLALDPTEVGLAWWFYGSRKNTSKVSVNVTALNGNSSLFEQPDDDGRWDSLPAICYPWIWRPLLPEIDRLWKPRRIVSAVSKRAAVLDSFPICLFDYPPAFPPEVAEDLWTEVVRYQNGLSLRSSFFFCNHKDGRGAYERVQSVVKLLRKKRK